MENNVPHLLTPNIDFRMFVEGHEFENSEALAASTNFMLPRPSYITTSVQDYKISDHNVFSPSVIKAMSKLSSGKLRFREHAHILCRELQSEVGHRLLSRNIVMQGRTLRSVSNSGREEKEKPVFESKLV